MLGREKAMEILSSALQKSRESFCMAASGSSPTTEIRLVGCTSSAVRYSENRIQESSHGSSCTVSAKDLGHLPEGEDEGGYEGEYVEVTATCPDYLMAAYVERVIAMAEERGMKAEGSLTIEVNELAMLNSSGPGEYSASTKATLTCRTTRGDTTGYAEASSADIVHIDPTDVALEAIQKCLGKTNYSSGTFSSESGSGISSL